MTSTALAFAAIAFALYIMAGQLMLAQLYFTASADERATEPVWQAIEAQALPRRARLAWLFLWLPITALAWLMARYAERGACRD